MSYRVISEPSQTKLEFDNADFRIDGSLICVESNVQVCRYEQTVPHRINAGTCSFDGIQLHPVLIATTIPV